MTAAAAALDPITAELIASSLIYASEEMGIGADVEGVPTDVGDFFCAFCEARAGFCEVAEAGLVRSFS